MAGSGRVSPPRRLRVPHEVAALVRGLHPMLKRKVRAALEALIRDPYGGKALRNELQGLRSYRVGRFRIIYRLREDIEVVAFGPRDSIYVETYRQLHEPRARYQSGSPAGRALRGRDPRSVAMREGAGKMMKGCSQPVPKRKPPPQSAASSYASGGGQAQARWRSP